MTFTRLYHDLNHVRRCYDSFLAISKEHCKFKYIFFLGRSLLFPHIYVYEIVMRHKVRSGKKIIRCYNTDTKELYPKGMKFSCDHKPFPLFMVKSKRIAT